VVLDVDQVLPVPEERCRDDTGGLLVLGDEGSTRSISSQATSPPMRFTDPATITTPNT
jgi:hypothetical protein